MCQMCQMPNIWYIWHTKHKNRTLSDVLKVSNFCNMLQYRCIFYTVRTQMAFVLYYFFYSSFSLIQLWATPSSLLWILLSLLPLCLIALSLVKDGFRCGYILAWALMWVKWWCGSWVWQRGGSRQVGSWRARSRQTGSQTHGRGEWVLMSSDGVWGGFLHPFFPLLFALSSLFDLYGCVWCGFCFWVCLIYPVDLSGYACVCACVCVCVCVFFFQGGIGGRGFVPMVAVGVVAAVVVGGHCCGSGGGIVVVVGGV